MAWHGNALTASQIVKIAVHARDFEEAASGSSGKFALIRSVRCGDGSERRARLNGIRLQTYERLTAQPIKSVASRS